MLDRLVPGRDCGDCTLCCTVLLLDTPDIQKPTGITCRHCAGGCAIHDTAPKVCREFYCGWRQLDIFSDDWRPDLSGVFAQIETDDIPAGFGFSTGIGLMLVGNPLKTIRQAWFLDFVMTGIQSGIPLFLSLPGPPGHQAAKILLNDAVPQALLNSSKTDRLRVKLEAALKSLRAHDFKPVAMINSPAE